MLFNTIILLIIILITLYLSTQGLLTSLIALVTAVFSSILAMALMEPLQNLVAGWRPDFARGGTLLAVFLVAYAVTRFAADAMIPENIKVPMMANRIGGGILGFFTALVVAGTLAAGIEMLPLPRSILGFNRYPGDQAMQASDAPQAGGVPIGDLTKAPADVRGVWLSPDIFVEAIWKSASKGGLGGEKAWAAVHPDLPAESYGYRSSVAGYSRRTIPADLFSVSEAWTTADGKQLASLGIPPEGSRDRLVWVRVNIKKGDKDPNTSNDPGDDPYFRITPTQIRLTAEKPSTEKMEQFYPVGYMEQGRSFHPTPLDGGQGGRQVSGGPVGHLVEDYANGTIIEDWVFLIGEDEKPAMVEMKEFGRAELAGVLKERKPDMLAATAYPPLEYRKDLSTVTAQFSAAGKKIEAANIYLIDSTSARQTMEAELHPAYLNVSNINGWIYDSTHGWSTVSKPGVPDAETFRQGHNTGQQMSNDPPDTQEQWTQALLIILVGQTPPSGEPNLGVYTDFFEQHMVPLWTKATPAVLHGTAAADASGAASLAGIVAGKYCLVGVMRTDRAFYVWMNPLNLNKASHENVTFSVGSGGGANFTVDLDQKVPGQ